MITRFSLFRLAFALATFFGNVAPVARAGIYITHPFGGVTCHAGDACTITWLDDGRSPLLSTIGSSKFELHYGTETLAQVIDADVDVSSIRSLTFQPDAKAGPDASSYFIQVSSNEVDGYIQYSGKFTITGMTGSAGSQVPSDVTGSGSAHATGTGTAITTIISTDGIVTTITLAPSVTISGSGIGTTATLPLTGPIINTSTTSVAATATKSAARRNAGGLFDAETRGGLVGAAVVLVGALLAGALL